MQTLDALAMKLASGHVSARTLVEDCLERVEDPAGEGQRAFIVVHASQARSMADAIDLLRSAGRSPGIYAGIPIGLKDLVDIAGETTRAGSRVLDDAPPALVNAPVVARLLAAGFIPMGRTNMTEFAFSGLGINPHRGTPSSPWDRATGRIPGGSSSGTAVAVADGMAFAGLGTDTGGSCRVPAAMCGIVGYKPTARRVPTSGVLPLSTSLDSIGPLANSVACCAAFDAVLAGEAVTPIAPTGLAGLRFAVPTNFVLDDLDADVADAFERTLKRLADAGAGISAVRFEEFGEIAQANAAGGFAGVEAFAWHRNLLAERGDEYDPQVLRRILRGEAMSGADYIDLLAARKVIRASMDAATRDYDALLMPTCPLIPQPIARLEQDAAEYNRVNLLQLRNPALGNFLDRCAISLPCHAPGEAPVGLMLMGETMGDARLFSIASAVEASLLAA